MSLRGWQHLLARVQISPLILVCYTGASRCERGAYLGNVGSVDAAVARRELGRLVRAAVFRVAVAAAAGRGRRSAVAVAVVRRAAARAAARHAVRVLVRYGDARPVADVVALAHRRHLGLEHVHGDDVDDHDPARAVEQLHVVLGERDRRDALHLELAPVRVGALQLAGHVLLELLHVEQLLETEKRDVIIGHRSNVAAAHQVSLAELEGALRQLQDVAAYPVLVGGVLDVDVALRDALDVDVALLVHAHLGALADLALGLLGAVVSHRVVEPVQADAARARQSTFELFNRAGKRFRPREAAQCVNGASRRVRRVRQTPGAPSGRRARHVVPFRNQDDKEDASTPENRVSARSEQLGSRVARRHASVATFAARGADGRSMTGEDGAPVSFWETSGKSVRERVKRGNAGAHRKPSKPSSLPLIWMGMARAYALATRRLRSITMSLAQISSSIWCHLSSTSWMWSCFYDSITNKKERQRLLLSSGNERRSHALPILESGTRISKIKRSRQQRDI